MDTATNRQQAQGELSFHRLAPATLCVRLAGQWTKTATLPALEALPSQLQTAPQVQRLTFDTEHLTGWDSVLLTFLLRLSGLCVSPYIEMDRSGLPQGVQRLLALATAVPERPGARRASVPESFLVRLGKRTLALWTAVTAFLTFLGEVALALGHVLRGRTHFRRADLLLLLQECGVQALPIVSLISFLVGLILAFVGAMQLKPFGAQLYVANLVGLAMAREMGAMMTGIIMAGRTGAAFAAQLGTMTVNQEIDALTTMGISPMGFLVVPRLLALAVMVPLLCIYADLMGILGGALIGVGTLQLGAIQYYQQTLSALTLSHFVVGIIKAAVFGVLVALAGCWRGMQCGRSASAVGAAATSAVVTSIVWIIVFDALLTVVYDVLGV